jgi:beta-lactam-binding protein with PASTA domain
MMRRVIALAAVAAIAVGAPSSAVAHADTSAAASPAISAYSFPQQCVVLPVENKSFSRARALLADLGCRVHRTWQSSTLHKNVVVTVVGGERTYAFGHVVTLIVSSGPTT